MDGPRSPRDKPIISTPRASPDKARSSAESQAQRRASNASVASQPHAPATPHSGRSQNADGKGTPTSRANNAPPGARPRGTRDGVGEKTEDLQQSLQTQTGAESLKMKLRRDALRTKFHAASGQLSEEQVRAFDAAHTPTR
jgi:hypothetical protein